MSEADRERKRKRNGKGGANWMARDYVIEQVLPGGAWSDVPTTGRYVLEAIAEGIHADRRSPRYGKAWPTVAMLMERTGLTQQALSVWFRKLEARGILTREREHGCTLYSIAGYPEAAAAPDFHNDVVEAHNVVVKIESATTPYDLLDDLDDGQASPEVDTSVSAQALPVAAEDVPSPAPDDEEGDVISEAEPRAADRHDGAVGGDAPSTSSSAASAAAGGTAVTSAADAAATHERQRTVHGLVLVPCGGGCGCGIDETYALTDPDGHGRCRNCRRRAPAVGDREVINIAAARRRRARGA